MIRRFRIVVLVAAAAAALSGQLPAQEANKLGMINSQEILEKSVEGRGYLPSFRKRKRSIGPISPGSTTRSSSSKTGKAPRD